MGHVAGYSIYNDVSVRDYQRHAQQIAAGKNFVGTGPFGPWLVTSDEVPDPTKLKLETRVNGDGAVIGHLASDLFDSAADQLLHPTFSISCRATSSPPDAGRCRLYPQAADLPEGRRRRRSRNREARRPPQSRDRRSRAVTAYDIRKTQMS